MCNAYSKINEFNKFTDLIFLEYAFNILLNLKNYEIFFNVEFDFASRMSGARI